MRTERIQRETKLHRIWPIYVHPNSDSPGFSTSFSRYSMVVAYKVKTTTSLQRPSPSMIENMWGYSSNFKIAMAAMISDETKMEQKTMIS